MHHAHHPRITYRGIYRRPYAPHPRRKTPNRTTASTARRHRPILTPIIRLTVRAVATLIRLTLLAIVGTIFVGAVLTLAVGTAAQRLSRRAITALR